VRNTGVEEYVALRREAMHFIEHEGPSLRVKEDLGHAARSCDCNQFTQQGRAYASIPPGAQDGHAADMSVGQQSSSTDCCPLFVLREHVLAIRIDTVPLERERYALLVHEDDLADVPERGLVAFPVRAPDTKRCAHRTDYSHAAPVRATCALMNPCTRVRNELGAESGLRVSAIDCDPTIVPPREFKQQMAQLCTPMSLQNA
jgi:hypothetical protein